MYIQSTPVNPNFFAGSDFFCLCFYTKMAPVNSNYRVIRTKLRWFHIIFTSHNPNFASFFRSVQRFRLLNRLFLSYEQVSRPDVTEVTQQMLQKHVSRGIVVEEEEQDEVKSVENTVTIKDALESLACIQRF